MPIWSNSTHWFRRKSADKKLCRCRQDPHQKHYAPTLPPLFCGGGGHNLSFIDPVVSEKMFEECGRRHRRACLYDKLTSQYIKRSARTIRPKICRIKMTYTFEDAASKRRQSNRTRLHRLISLFQTSHTKQILKCDFALKLFLRKHIGQTFIFIDSTFQMFHRSRLCQGPNSENVKLALSLEPYGIV